MRGVLKRCGSWLVRIFGSRIEDYRTGESLGRALILVWRGRIHVIGYTGEKPLLIDFLAEDEVRYWRSRIGFTTQGKDWDA